MLLCDGSVTDGTVLKNPNADAGEAREASLIPELERFLEKETQPASGFLPGKFHEQRSLMS